MDAVNAQLLIVPMIETQEALDRIDDILSVDGIDVLLVGPSDLSINLDVPLDYANAKYRAALEKIAAACTKARVAPGMFFVPPGIPPAELMAKGFRFFTLPWAPWAADGIRNGLAEVKGLSRHAEQAGRLARPACSRKAAPKASLLASGRRGAFLRLLLRAVGRRVVGHAAGFVAVENGQPFHDPAVRPEVAAGAVQRGAVVPHGD